MFINTHILYGIQLLFIVYFGSKHKTLTSIHLMLNIYYCYITHGSTVWKNVFDIDSSRTQKNHTGRLFWSDFLYIRRNEAGNAQRKLKNETLHTLHNLHPTYLLSLFFVLSLFFPFPCIRCFYRLLCLPSGSAEPFATACARTAEKQKVSFFFAE